MEKSQERQVRTLDGQSVKVMLTAEDTVQHLKHHLEQLKWPPNSEPSLQFHIFFRGSKLGDSTQLRSLPLLNDDFLVLVPFARKKKSKRRKVDSECEKAAHDQNSRANPQMKEEEIIGSAKSIQSTGAGVTVPQSEIIELTESTWRAIVADFATVNTLCEDTTVKALGDEMNLSHERGTNIGEIEFDFFRQFPINQNVQSERKFGAGASTAYETSAEKAGENIFFSSKPRKPAPESSGASESLDEEAGPQELPLRVRKPWVQEKMQGFLPASKVFALPLVLRKLNWVFLSLNTVCGFLQNQHIQATWRNVRQALQHLCCPEEEQAKVEDIHVLAMLFPKLVVLSNMTGEGENSSFYINLLDPSTLKKEELVSEANAEIATNIEQIDLSDWMPKSVGKPVSDKRIRNAVGRREKAFQKALTKLVEYVQKSEKLSQKGVNDVTIEEYVDIASTITEEDKQRTVNGALPRPPRGHKKLPRCTGELVQSVVNLGALEMMEHLKKGLGSLGQFVHSEHIQHRKAAYGELQKPLTTETNAALKQMGINRLYTHQAQAINAVKSGENAVVATSTASGKSLCYNIPVLDELFQNEESCALYLFPTKALAQDQLRALQAITKNTEIRIRMGVYDGDTPQDHRLILRDSARLLITNPDMLHVSIMPSHRQFSRILSNLRFVVLDEAHAYRGVFGCHTALILRRLRRLCHHVYGIEPTFIVCSATIANPSGHAQELIGLRKIQVVQNDGSPCGDKHFVFWNPPLCYVPTSGKRKDKLSANRDPGRASGANMRRTRYLYEASHCTAAYEYPINIHGKWPTLETADVDSSIVEVATLLAEMVQHGLRCIAFCKTRKLCELVYKYTQEILKETAPELVGSIRSYRGGYSASERRSIESDLFGGNLRGVAATNALELGVDIGSLDATLHLGFPGTVASLWQQSGRAGRREKPSLSVYVAFGGPLDQHFMKTPSKLFARPIENAQVDAHNHQVLEQHLACAAVEYPLHVEYDNKYFGSGLQTVISELVKQGRLGGHPSNCPRDGSWNYIGQDKFPSQAVTIRAIDPEKYKIIDVLTNEIIEEVEESMAFFEVYEGAVYMNQGKTYIVKTLDLAAKVAFCKEADLKYYTRTRDFTDVHVTGGEVAHPRNICENEYRSTTAVASTCKVTSRWVGFHRIWRGTNDRFDYVDLFLPDISYDSHAAWIRVPPHVRLDLAAEELPFMAGLHAANHALLNVMPLYVMCNSSDLGTECANDMGTRYFPERLLVFDRHPGGIGIAPQARPMFTEILQAALEQLVACDCTADDGCPCCVQIVDCGEYNQCINKRAALSIIQRVIQAEDSYRQTKEKAASPPDGFLNEAFI